MKRIANLAAVIALLGVMATAAGAAPGGKTAPTGGGTRVSAELVIPDTTLNAPTDVRILNGTAEAWVEIYCYQGGDRVTYDWFKVTDGHATFSVDDSTWYEHGLGGADCQARADSWNVRRQRYELLDTTTFHVADA